MSTMIKLVYCLRRLPSMSRAEFQKYWREKHAPLVASHAVTLGIKRYVQTHTMESPLNESLRASRGCDDEAFDGVAELWWDNVESFADPVGTDEGRKAAQELAADEAKFIDFKRSVIWVGEENEVVPA